MEFPFWTPFDAFSSVILGVLEGCTKNLPTSRVKREFCCIGPTSGQKVMFCSRGANVQKKRSSLSCKTTISGVVGVESGRFAREGRRCNTFSIVKHMPFVPIGTVNGHSVREWRASLFFPTVKLDDFCNFWGLFRRKWTFCSRGANVQHFFRRKIHTFCIDPDRKWSFRSRVASVTFFSDGKTR